MRRQLRLLRSDLWIIGEIACIYTADRLSDLTDAVGHLGGFCYRRAKRIQGK